MDDEVDDDKNNNNNDGGNDDTHFVCDFLQELVGDYQLNAPQSFLKREGSFNLNW